VRATGGIGPFVLVAESAVASGVRRIEAVSGGPALAVLSAQRETLERAAGLLRCPPRELEARIQKLLDERRELEQSVKALKTQAAAAALSGSKGGGTEDIGGVKVMIAETAAADPGALRELADRTLDQLKEGVVVLGSRGEDKLHLLVRVSKGLVARVNASDVVKAAASVVGGTGGGKPEMAQAGGKEPGKLPEALESARRFLAGKLGG
jgi:alanyl-tRNA synthetase